MYYCPSCGSKLDNDGICASCGALSRGFFRDLDLGAPQIAAAVQHGLDFYLLLGVPPAGDLRAMARRYRQLRALFPDNPSRLRAAAARRLELLEVAGRTLTDSYLRRVYDELRAKHDAVITTEVVRCVACAAPLPPAAAKCAFCGTPRPGAAVPPATPPTEGVPPPTEPVDYYAMLGLNAVHLLPEHRALVRNREIMSPFGMGGTTLTPERTAPSPTDVDMAAAERERELLLNSGMPNEQRTARLDAIEIARRILRDDRRREQYDQLLRDFQQGRLNGGRLDALHSLEQETRMEMAEERGEQIPASEGQALLQQGVGYMEAELPREAAAALSRAVRALPHDAHAHAAYIGALLAAEEPLDMGAHTLRQILASLDELDALGAPHENGPALRALCRGLLARDQGNYAEAMSELQQAVQLDKHLAPGWRGLAAIALFRGDHDDAFVACRRALACEPRNERTLLMLVGACLRSGQTRQAHEAAGQLAALRGGSWTAESVLREVS
jgi:tetratricopeptide (TPR) repeat protein